MISLLLTLFISLLSIGSSINTIDETRESGISTISNNCMDSLNLQDSKPINNTIYYNNYYYFGFDELVTYNNFNLFFDWIKQNDYFPMSDTKVENFILYDPVTINLSGYDVAVGDFDEFEFVPNIQASNSFEYIKFSYDRTNEYEWIYEFSFKYSNYVHVAKGTYSFLGDESKVISNIVITRNGTPSTFPNACLKFNATQFASLFGCYNTPKDSYDVGRADGYRSGYQTGYNEGLAHADYDSTALTIFTGITTIALVPINMFLKIFNFEILGINLSGFISGILTIAVVVIIIRMITGGKKDD